MSSSSPSMIVARAADIVRREAERSEETDADDGGVREKGVAGDAAN